MLSVPAWSLKAMAAGTHPAQRHDGTGWRQEDQGRASFGWQARPLLVKGGLGPICPFPRVPNIHKLQGALSTVLLHHRKHALDPELHPVRAGACRGTLGMYERSCAATEVKVTIPAAEMPKVREALIDDVWIGGQRNRNLALPVPSLGLQKGNQLEPAPWAMDPSWLDDATAPAEILWWRSSRDGVQAQPFILGRSQHRAEQHLPGLDAHFDFGRVPFFCAPLVWALLENA